MGVSVRVAGDSDVVALAALRRRWNEENAGAEIRDENFDAVFARWRAAERDTRTFFLAEHGRLAIGMANVKRYDRMPVAGAADAGSWGYVGNVFVVPEQRNAGVGQELMSAILTWATEQRFGHLRLAPSPRSHTFYQRLGYVPGAVVELDPPASTD